MNSTRISKLILSLLFLCLVTTGRAQTFPRLLLGGDYPDPSIIREGKDFYMTNSSFNYAPGLLVWHSTDLVNWTPIARALHALDGSVYAPYLVKYKGPLIDHDSYMEDRLAEGFFLLASNPQ